MGCLFVCLHIFPFVCVCVCAWEGVGGVVGGGGGGGGVAGRGCVVATHAYYVWLVRCGGW